MLFGRPTNLWLGLITAGAGFAQVLIVTLRPDLNAAAVATVIGSLSAFLGVFVAFLAGQPPTLNPGDTFHVVTPAGQPNAVTTVATPPAADPPPIMPQPQP